MTPLVAPLPFRNSQIGWGGVLMLGVIHRFDPDTALKPSTGAVAGFASENGSWGIMGLEVARFAGDRWRARGAAGYMDLQYDFYGIGNDAGEAGRSIPIEQTIVLASGLLLRRVAADLYIGASLLWMETTVTPQDSAGPNEPLVPDQSRARLVAPGVQWSSTAVTTTTGLSEGPWCRSRGSSSAPRAGSPAPSSGTWQPGPGTTGCGAHGSWQ